MNRKAIENFGLTPNLKDLKRDFQKRGKYYEILEISIDREYKILILLDNTEIEGLKEAYKIALGYLFHELKTPFAIALSYLERLEPHILKESTEEEVKILFQKVQTSFKGLDKLLKKLFSSIEYLAKDIKFAKAPFNLREAIDEAVFWVSPLAEEKKVSIEYDLRDNLIVIGSLELFIQALFNLVENAVKASPEGKKVIIRSLPLSSEKILLIIRDFGKGVPPEKIGFLGKPFFKLSEGEGMGLGVFIAKRIIEAHHGELKFHLPTDGGLEVNIIIPCHYEKNEKHS
ncbi:MAG: sensor histidine kinase [Caldimicrobium sp.]